jgi:hypothetical protein
MTACAHPNRASPNAIRRLAKSGTQFVLVFGSLSTLNGRPPRPVIRFVYQKDQSHPEYLLGSLPVSGHQRFHAILQPPKDAARSIPYLDHFYIEIGSVKTGFDRVLYIHLRESAAPLAMYVGEIVMAPAENRTAAGAKLTLSVTDDFHHAAAELKRLYPQFEGGLDDEARLLPKSSPEARPPERIR